MIDYYSSPLAVSTLLQAAHGWQGTPFEAFQCARGAGVDCVHLAAALYVESGHLRAIPRFPRYTMDGGKHSTKNVIRDWLEASGQFRLLFEKTPLRPVAEPPSIGDLLCFDLGRVEWHVGVMVNGNEFVEVHERATAGRRTLADSTWSRRLKAIWRPIIPT